MPRKSGFTFETSGPFFDRDPRKTFRQNIRLLTAAIAKEGEAGVQAELRGGEGSRKPLRHGIHPARVSAHVVGRTANLAGRPWAVTAKVSVNNRQLSRAQGVSLMAAAARLEARGHAFRRVASALRRARAVNAAELLKGIA